MALVKCGECGSAVSDKADACPKCGNPFGRRRSRSVAIEKTGKGIKSMMLFSSLLIAGSVLMFFAHAVPEHEILGSVGVVIGLLLRAYAAIAKWWEHD